MSRFNSDYYEQDFPNQGELWWANARRALAGRKGQKALAELREALLALPGKRLIEGALCTVGATAEAQAMPLQVPRWDGNGTHTNWQREDLLEVVRQQGEGVCAIGALAWWRKVKAGVDPQEAFAQLPRLLAEDGGDIETAKLGQRDLGLTFTLAWTLASRNDEDFGGMTPEARYEAFLAWIDKQLAARVGFDG